MAQCVNAYLRYDPKLGPSPAEQWVKTYEVGRDVRWTDDRLLLEFTGNRVEVIGKPGHGGQAAVRINGRRPSEFPELYGFTRAVTKPGGKWPVKWPVIAPITSERPLLLEDWTLAAKREDAEGKIFSFTLAGSKTGPDGAGHSDTRFVSNSGRVVIETNDWNVTYALSLAGIKPAPEQFEVKWKVEAQFADEVVFPDVKDASMEMAVTVAQGLPKGRQLLEISGSDSSPIAAIRIYCPPAVPASHH